MRITASLCFVHRDHVLELQAWLLGLLEDYQALSSASPPLESSWYFDEATRRSEEIGGERQNVVEGAKAMNKDW